jgi:hypothetical protein
MSIPDSQPETLLSYPSVVRRCRRCLVYRDVVPFSEKFDPHQGDIGEHRSNLEVKQVECGANQ